MESTKLKISMWQNITETLIYFLDNEDIQDKKSVSINQQKEHLIMYINKFNPFCTLLIYFFIGINKIIVISDYVRLFQRPKGTVCKGRTAQEGAGAS